MSIATPMPSILSWPLEGIDKDGNFKYTSDDDSVREVIRNILLTRPGERLRRATFGAGLLDFIHLPNNVTTRTLMANVIKEAVEQWETRVLVEGVEVLPDPKYLSRVHINIRYRLRHTQLANQLVLSLDINKL